MSVIYAGMILIGAAIGLAGSVWRLFALMILAFVAIMLSTPLFGFVEAAFACLMSAVSMQLGYFAAILLRAYFAEDPPVEVAVTVRTTVHSLADSTNLRTGA